jgi:hypothetical protein
VPHTDAAVRLSQYLSAVFVQQARLNDLTLGDGLNAALIDNYPAVFTAKNGGYFEQTYFFNPPSSP